MIYEVIINNYQIGAKLQTAPQNKIVKKERLNEKATLIQFKDLDGFDIQLIERLFGRKLHLKK